MIASTWEAHCTEYKPGEYGRDVTADALQRDADSLGRVLAAARARLDQRACGWAA